MLRLRTAARVAAVGAVTLMATTAALGLPWDVDMADSVAFKAYERPMSPLPEGVVSQPNVLSASRYVPNYDRMQPDGQALRNPYPTDDEALATGAHMFEVYCTPCHGDGVTNGPVAEPGRMPGVVTLLGDAGVMRTRTDGWVYLTIRNGGAIMPPYGYAMTDEEMWAIVTYLRRQPGGRYVPPPAEEETTP